MLEYKPVDPFEQQLCLGLMLWMKQGVKDQEPNEIRREIIKRNRINIGKKV